MTKRNKLLEQLATPATEHDDILPHEEHNPEQRLWAACLLHAVREAGKGDLDEVDWIFTYRHAVHIGSYSWVCESIDIEPEHLRALLVTKWHWVKGYLHRKNIGRPDYDRREYVREQRARRLNLERLKRRSRSTRDHHSITHEKNGHKA